MVNARERLTRQIERLTAHRNRLNERLDDLIMELAQLEVDENDGPRRPIPRPHDWSPYTRGTRVTILTGSLAGQSATLLRKLTVEEKGDDNRWEFRVVGGPHDGRMTYRKQKNLVFVAPPQQEEARP